MTLRIIAGKFKGRTLVTPKSKTTRPTQGMLREAIFNICQNEIEGTRFLDLFAGSGAVGFEALSRGAKEVTFIEQNMEAIRSIKANIATLAVEPFAHLIPQGASRALQILKKKQAQFDLIYADPPYDLPFNFGDLSSLLAPAATLFLEERLSSKTTPPEIEGLCLKETRRFASARVTIYKINT